MGIPPEGRYRVAVVGGAGSWGQDYMRAYATHPRAQLVALVDRSRDRRQAFADGYGIPQVFDDVEDLLAAEVPDTSRTAEWLRIWQMTTYTWIVRPTVAWACRAA